MARAVLATVLVLLLISGCGTGSSSSPTTAERFRPFRIPFEGTPPLRREGQVKAAWDGRGLLGPEPRPLMPKGPPPEFLSSRDLIQGIGHLATPGKVITVQYVGAEYRTGRIFASSWKQGRPYTFRLGAGREIRGWEEGIEGMEVGDRRELVIPADLGYGGRRKGSIPPDSALVFVIDLLRVQ